MTAGADLWLRNHAGNLAVFEAEQAGKDDIVAYLLQSGGTEKEKDDSAGSSEQEVTLDQEAPQPDEDTNMTDATATGDIQTSAD